MADWQCRCHGRWHVLVAGDQAVAKAKEGGRPSSDVGRARSCSKAKGLVKCVVAGLV